MPYRVFISYKHTPESGKGVTRDYYIAADLHQTLTRAGIATFFSEKDLSTGDYVNEIYDALEEADIMVVVGTKPAYIRSQWVREEWSTFGAEINGRRKPNGDMYTYLEGMSVNDLPSMLYKRQSYTTQQKDALVQRIKTQLGINEESQPKPVQEPKPKPVKEKKPKPVKEPKPKPVKEPKPTEKPTALKPAPFIAAIAVVLVVALVGSLWAAIGTGGKPEAETDGSSSGTVSSEIPALSQLTSISKGDHFTFGNYPQGENGEVQPIEWRVLDVQDIRALVISEKLLDCVKYNEEYTSVTWETCTLRSWMNNDFLKQAFSSSEQAKIATVTNQNPDNPEYGTKGGNATQDEIFALSIDEANQYFSNDDDRMAAPTEYAIKQGAYVSDNYSLSSGEKTGWWWLRSPGFSGSYAARVDTDGDVSQGGDGVNIYGGAVRPAFWLNLS